MSIDTDQDCIWCGGKISLHMWDELRNCLYRISTEEMRAPAITYDAYKAKLKGEWEETLAQQDLFWVTRPGRIITWLRKKGVFQ